MDSLTLTVDAVSIIGFLIVIIVGTYAIRNFRQSKQALTESASLISVIVDALTSRIEQSESAVNMVQTEMDGLKARGAGLEWEQGALRSSHIQLLRSLQEILSNDKRLIAELELLKRKVGTSQTRRIGTELPSKRSQLGGIVGPGEILAALTPTEHATLEILLHEGPIAAPELGKRINKSREHTSRLMKKLYLEGYVDRESNRAPFRYRLSDTVRSALQPTNGAITPGQAE